MDFGSLEWGHRRGGRVTLWERLRETWHSTEFVYQQMRAALGWKSPKLPHAELYDIIVPDSKIAKEAWELCRESSNPPLVAHCERTFLYGSLVASGQGLSFDPELFYVTALLHDLALTPRFAFSYDAAECFAYEGALCALDFAQERNWEHGPVMADAICRHLNVRVKPEDGAEAYLLRRGSSMDVLGQGYGSLRSQTREDVLERHPREELKAELHRSMAHQNSQRGQCRLHHLSCLGFQQFVKMAPFES